MSLPRPLLVFVSFSRSFWSSGVHLIICGPGVWRETYHSLLSPGSATNAGWVPRWLLITSIIRPVFCFPFDWFWFQVFINKKPELNIHSFVIKHMMKKAALFGLWKCVLGKLNYFSRARAKRCRGREADTIKTAEWQTCITRWSEVKRRSWKCKLTTTCCHCHKEHRQTLVSNISNQFWDLLGCTGWAVGAKICPFQLSECCKAPETYNFWASEWSVMLFVVLIEFLVKSV